MRRITLAMSFLILVQLSACDRNRIFEKNVKFENRNWPQERTVSFRFEIDDIRSTYDFYCNLRNSILYKYQNLYISYVLEDTLGNVYLQDLANIKLFQSKTGEPLGDGMGDIFDHQYKVIENFSFKNPGIYQFNINHYMRPDSLREIMAVGLRIEKNPVE